MCCFVGTLTKAQAVFPQQCGPLSQRRMGSTCKPGLWLHHAHVLPSGTGGGTSLILPPKHSLTRAEPGKQQHDCCRVCSRSWTWVPGSASSPVLAHTLLEPGGQQLTSPCTYEGKEVWWAALQAVWAQAKVIWHSKLKPSLVSGWKSCMGIDKGTRW